MSRAKRASLIYYEMSRLAALHNAVDLAQGAPDSSGPQKVIAHAAKVLLEGNQQYTSPNGPLYLRTALANDAKKRFGATLDPEKQVVVTTGAQAALGCAMFGLIEPGDEVLIIEPFYNSCINQAQRAGASLRYLSLKGLEFRLDEDELMAAMSERTKLILVNSPNNPCGRVLSRGELLMLARACDRFDAFVVSDEVYEYFVYDDHQHTSALEVPELAHRALSISSFSKTYLMTGWRVGWVRGAAPLVERVAAMHSIMSYCLPEHLCEGARFAIEELPASYYEELRRVHMAKRDLLCGPLREAGIEVISPQGSPFAAIDIRSLGESDDLDFCERLPQEVGVSAVPMSLSWHERRWGRHLIRLCFTKKDETLKRGVDALCRFAATRRATGCP